MTTVGEMKQHVASLVETNRALASDLDASRARIAKLSRQRDSDATRAHGAESQTRALERELRHVASERDDFMAQLAEATDALNEIRDSLRSRLSSMEPCGWNAQPSYY